MTLAMEVDLPTDKQSLTLNLKALWTRQLECWFRGERLPVEYFLREHPELRSDPRLVDLVCNEFSLRKAMGDDPDCEAYVRRFPEFAGQLRRRLGSDRPDGESASPETEDSFEEQSVAIEHPALSAGESPDLDETKVEQPGQVKIPGYEILGQLGRGGMGVVYQARHLGLNRVVALKMIQGSREISPEELGRLRAEARAVAQFKHPNIVQVYDVGEHEGLGYFSLEFVDGGTLDEKLERKPLPPQKAAELVETLARAIHSAHEKQIIHRDLKPGNILLTHDGVPKIADFGLAQEMNSDGQAGDERRAVGTPCYMAPEQAYGNTADLGPPTDVYALGSILYEILTGRPPFMGANVMETLTQVVTAEPVPPSRLQPRCPRDLETICLKCLEKPPSKRYATALELADDLRRFLHGEPIHARTMGRAERLWRWCRRNPIAASLLLTVSLGSAFGMVHLSRLSQDLVHSTALEGARQEAEFLEEVNDFYSAEVVDRVTPHGIKATSAYRSQPGTLPAPATLTIDLGDHISANSRLGTRVRLYSDLPFRGRKEGGAKDDFEREALERLRADPETPYYRFEEYEGRPTLRYAQARRMGPSCVACHNSHPDSPRKGWKVGDVRGVVEVIRPLEIDERRTAAGLRGTFFLTAAAAGVLLLLSSLVLFFSHPRRRQIN
jgi:serine/threonine protein kinase